MPATISLDVVDIPRPCPANWDDMRGDARSRFCDNCHKHVYNLSEMTRDEAEALIAEKEGNLCARLYRRLDGTVITTDCGGGWKLRARRFGTLVGVACAAVLSGICAPYVFGNDSIASSDAMDVVPPARLVDRVIRKLKGEPPAPPPTSQMVMGVMVCPTPRTNNSGGGGSGAGLFSGSSGATK